MAAVGLGLLSAHGRAVTMQNAQNGLLRLLELLQLLANEEAAGLAVVDGRERARKREQPRIKP